MKTTIIIPVYNTARWLEECLDSVAAQDSSGWECLLVDDGSSDDSGAVCDRRAAADPRFRVIHTPNRGVSAARNTGIDHARGTFLAFVDSDDTVAPDYLSTLLRTIDRSGADLAVCGLSRVGPTGVQTVEPRPGSFTVDAAGSDRFVELIRTHLLYPPYSKLYRADIVRTRAVRFPEGVHYGEDLVFNFRYLDHTRTVATARAHPYRYRVDPSGQSLSASVHSRDHAANYGQWRLIRDFFDRRDIASPAAAEYLSNRLWGIAYDTAMNVRLSPRAIGVAFGRGFTRDLRAAAPPTVDIPRWLRVIVSNRLTPLIWLIQRRCGRPQSHRK